jgi:hypothetical protein
MLVVAATLRASRPAPPRGRAGRGGAWPRHAGSRTTFPAPNGDWWRQTTLGATVRGSWPWVRGPPGAAYPTCTTARTLELGLALARPAAGRSEPLLVLSSHRLTRVVAGGLETGVVLARMLACIDCLATRCRIADKLGSSLLGWWMWSCGHEVVRSWFWWRVFLLGGSR